jgi:hypothetical protein
MSKKAKALRQMQKDEQMETTERLNDLFSNLQSEGTLVPGRGPADKLKKSESNTDLSYDEMV